MWWAIIIFGAVLALVDHNTGRHLARMSFLELFALLFAVGVIWMLAAS